MATCGSLLMFHEWLRGQLKLAGKSLKFLRATLDDSGNEILIGFETLEAKVGKSVHMYPQVCHTHA